jgi:multicomponent Na+:H+ antiporter subunit E
LNATSSGAPRTLGAAFLRGAGFLTLWVVLIGFALADLAAGVLTVAVATWASLHLLPPGASNVRLVTLPGLAARFLGQSIIAGWDVARRALDPRLPLSPGFVEYRCGFKPGLARNAFASLTSLLPGTVPVQDDGETLLYHCLDVNQPVIAQLGAEEVLFARTLDRMPPP